MDYQSAIQKLAVQLRKRNHRNEELTVGKHHWKVEKQPEWYVKAVRKTIAALPGGYAEAADWLDVTENALFNRLRADGDQIFPLGWAMVLQRAAGTHYIADVWGDTVVECVLNKLCPSHTYVIFKYPE